MKMLLEFMDYGLKAIKAILQPLKRENSSLPSSFKLVIKHQADYDENIYTFTMLIDGELILFYHSMPHILVCINVYM